MNIVIKAHHVEITSALHDYAEKKMSKLEKYSHNIQDVLVELNISDVADEEHRQEANGTVHVSGATLHADVASIDMYASIDMLLDKLERQVKKHKDKMISHKRGSDKRSLTGTFHGSQVSSTAQKSVKLKNHYIPKPMTVEEAADVLEADALGFLVFRNAQNEKINVVYTREDGEVDLIEP